MFDKNKGNRQPAQDETAKTAPAMTAKPAASAGASEMVAMIGEGINVTGDVSASSNLKVGGLIEGRSVTSSHNIEVADSGIVKASITAKEIRIAGQVAGDISGSEKVVITRSGRVQGNIVSPRVQLDDGALFRGSIDMNPADKAADKKPAAASVAAAKPAPSLSDTTAGSKPMGTDTVKGNASDKKAG